MKPIHNTIRVNHIPQVPGKAFSIEVKDEWEAKKISDTLAQQHLWLHENKIIPDYSNTISVVMWDEDLEPDENGEKWTDYWNDREEMDWYELEQKHLSKPDNRELINRFFLEEIVHRLKNEDMDYVKTLSSDWLQEMTDNIPLTEDRRKWIIKNLLGWDRDFAIAAYFKSEEDLDKFLKPE